jgi:predicted metal-dependent HD superfamily phosphohydrolase
MWDAEDHPILTQHEQMALEYAIWFHDAVYDPKAGWGINEEESASMAYGWFFRENQQFYHQVSFICSKMISATSNHKPNTEAEKCFCDIDLSILGKPSAEYDLYAENIRKEYSFVPQKLYAQKRVEILKRFLSGPIYKTPYFHAKYEEPARVNIQNEIRSLSLWL